MSKDISITTDRIRVTHTVSLWKNATFTVVNFDTNNQYLMTDPTGTFKAGGYEKCPTFYGRSSDPASGITDKDNGWWPTDLLQGNFSYSNTSDIYLDVPSWSNWKILQRGIAVQDSRTYYSSYQYLYIDGAISGTFRWRAAPNDYDSHMSIAPIDFSLWYSDRSGLLRLPYVSINNWVANWRDGYGNANSRTFLQGERYSSYGNYYWSDPSPVFLPTCLMFVKNPVTLAVVVTP